MTVAPAVRKLHKWLALIVGVQALLWTATGLYMTAVDIDFIHGDHFIRTPAVARFDLSALAEPGPLVDSVAGPTSLRLIRRSGRPVYVVEGAGQPRIFDALTGERSSLPEEAEVRALAASYYGGEGRIAKVELLETVPGEIRGRPAPVWRVEFDHWNRPTLYLSPHTGELLSRRHELWRVFDVAWMLHIMDYETREDVNNTLLRAATMLTALLALSGAALLVWSFSRRRAAKRSKALRFSPVLWRRIHKWVGLVIGAQLILWTVSGAGMALLDHGKVAGEHARLAGPIDGGIVAPAALVGSVNSRRVQELALRALDDRLVYAVTTPAGPRLLDARTAERVVVDAELAATLARHGMEGAIRRVTRVEAPTVEIRDRHGPAFRVDFADDERTSVYVSADTGEVLQHRTDTWRLFDILWMLHTMDYRGRDDFNHPLIVVVAFGAIWLAATGFYLLFKSFRRRDFRWLAWRS